MHAHARPFMLILKRASDIVLASVGLIVLFPVLGAIALAIRIDSPGPALFRQEREGRGGETFRIWKFRSMQHDVDPSRTLTTKSDARITRIGTFLRRTSLDEFPQLFNVICGDMSLVGPRPLLPGTTVQAEIGRLGMRPGMTGLVEVSDPEQLDWDDRMKLDVWYVDHWRFWLDIVILLRTIPIFLLRKDVVDPPRVSPPVTTERVS